MIYWIMWFLVSTAYFWAFPTKIIGKKYLKLIKKDSAILSYNHQTNNDAILIKAKICPKAKMMAKHTLFNGKCKAWFFRTLGAYPVNREGNDISAVKTTLKYLKENNKVGIAPEGTRVKEGESVEFKNGVVMFALKTNCYIVPIVFRKTTKAFKFNTVIIGKPFRLSEIEEFKDKKADKELLDRATEILTEKMNYLKNVKIKEYKKIIKDDFKKMKKSMKDTKK